MEVVLLALERRRIQMRILMASALFVIASSLPAPTVDAAITQTYVKCFAAHWNGTESTTVKNSGQIVSLSCGEFWKTKKTHATPFLLDSEPIPYSEWSKALGNLMTISKEPK